ncbi:hypothetical protein PG995_006388 [Apiospora arundinis]
MPENIRKTRSAAAAANKDKASSEPKRPNNSASNDNSDNGSGSRKKAKTTQEQITGEPEVDEVTEDKKTKRITSLKRSTSLKETTSLWRTCARTLRGSRRRPRAFRRKLLSIKCGNSDNGYGAGLHDDALVKLAQPCPGLQNAVLELCTAISDQGLASLLKSCPGMRTVSITGHDRGRGRITSKGLDALNKDKTLGAKLLKLHSTSTRRPSRG